MLNNNTFAIGQILLPMKVQKLCESDCISIWFSISSFILSLFSELSNMVLEHISINLVSGLVVGYDNTHVRRI